MDTSCFLLVSPFPWLTCVPLFFICVSLASSLRLSIPLSVLFLELPVSVWLPQPFQVIVLLHRCFVSLSSSLCLAFSLSLCHFHLFFSITVLFRLSMFFFPLLSVSICLFICLRPFLSIYLSIFTLKFNGAAVTVVTVTALKTEVEEDTRYQGSEERKKKHSLLPVINQLSY